MDTTLGKIGFTKIAPQITKFEEDKVEVVAVRNIDEDEKVEVTQPNAIFIKMGPNGSVYTSDVCTLVGLAGYFGDNLTNITDECITFLNFIDKFTIEIYEREEKYDPEKINKLVEFFKNDNSILSQNEFNKIYSSLEKDYRRHLESDLYRCFEKGDHHLIIYLAYIADKYGQHLLMEQILLKVGLSNKQELVPIVAVASYHLALVYGVKVSFIKKNKSCLNQKKIEKAMYWLGRAIELEYPKTEFDFKLHDLFSVKELEVNSSDKSTNLSQDLKSFRDFCNSVTNGKTAKAAEEDCSNVNNYNYLSELVNNTNKILTDIEFNNLFLKLSVLEKRRLVNEYYESFNQGKDHLIFYLAYIANDYGYKLSFEEKLINLCHSDNKIIAAAACYQLAKLYANEKGFNHKSKVAAATYLLGLAAIMGHVDAEFHFHMYRLISNVEGNVDHNALIDYTRREMNKGRVEACNYYSQCLLKDRKKFDDEVEMYYKQGVVAGDANAMLNLAQFYEKSQDKSKIKEALHLYQEAAARGLVSAHYGLGRLYERDLLGEPDFAAAVYHYKLAAENKDLTSIKRLANCYEKGQCGIAVDYEQAFLCYIQALEFGYLSVLHDLYRFYSKELIDQKLLESHKQVFIKGCYQAIEDGQKSAYYLLAMGILDGYIFNSPLEPNTPFKYLNEAVKGDFLPAYLALGLCRIYGRNHIEIDIKEGLKLIEAADKKRYTPAQQWLQKNASKMAELEKLHTEIRQSFIEFVKENKTEEIYNLISKISYQQLNLLLYSVSFKYADLSGNVQVNFRRDCLIQESFLADDDDVLVFTDEFGEVNYVVKVRSYLELFNNNDNIPATNNSPKLLKLKHSMRLNETRADKKSKNWSNAILIQVKDNFYDSDVCELVGIKVQPEDTLVKTKDQIITLKELILKFQGCSYPLNAQEQQIEDKNLNYLTNLIDNKEKIITEIEFNHYYLSLSQSGKNLLALKYYKNFKHDADHLIIYLAFIAQNLGQRRLKFEILKNNIHSENEVIAAAARYQLAKCYAYGDGCVYNVKMARSYYEDAAKLDHVEAVFICKVLQLLSQKIVKDKKEEIIKYLESEIINGRIEAYNYYGHFLEKITNSYDVIKIMENYELGAKAGDPRAMFNLARLLMKSQEQTKIQEALEWFHKAAEHGYVHAAYELGKLYESNWLGKSDFDLAFFYYELAAKANHIKAILYLGSCYEKGRCGRMQDYAQAFKWYLKALELEHLPVIHNIHKFYNNQWINVKTMMRNQALFYSVCNLAKDSTQTDDKLQKIAYYYLAMGYLDSYFVTTNFQLPIDYLKIALDAGYLPALFEYARCHIEGRKIKIDLAIGLESLESACQHKYIPALQYSAKLYYGGLFVKQDLDKSNSYLRQLLIELVKEKQAKELYALMCNTSDSQLKGLLFSVSFEYANLSPELKQKFPTDLLTKQPLTATDKVLVFTDEDGTPNCVVKVTSYLDLIPSQRFNPATKKCPLLQLATDH